MQLAMRRMGLTTEPLDGVEEVVVRTRDKEFVFKEPEVTILTIQGVRTYQVVGSPTTRPRTASADEAAPAAPAPSGPPEEDIELVMEQGHATREEAVRALRETDGAPAEAIMKLLSKRGPGGG
jgi:nascent polypeptide-associated complex subunit alpha